MARLKVLFVPAWYPSAAQPVMGIFVRQHARAVRLYDDVAVLHCAGLNTGLGPIWQVTPETSPELTAGIPTWRVEHRLSWIKPAYGVYVWSIYQAYRQIAATGFRPDIIHAHIYQAGVPALVLARLLRVPLVISEHFTAFRTRTLPPREIRLARVAFAQADRVLPVSHALQAAIAGHGIHACFCVVPNVVDTALFFPANGERPGSVPAGPVRRMLLVGLLSPNKGLQHLLPALARLHRERADWRLDVVGDGPQRAEYQALAHDLGLDGCVVFHGARTPAEVAGFMRRSDLLVSASVVETFSVVAAEALACGLPVLATRSGGPEEFVTEDVGLTVPPGDPAALHDGLVSMLDRLPGFDAARIATYARDCFSPERVGGQLDALYHELVHHSSPVAES